MRTLSWRLLPATVLSLALLLAGCAAGTLERAGTPESVGLSQARLKALSASMQASVDKAEIPGAVVLVARKGKVVMLEAYGSRDKLQAAPMQRDTIFRAASMTKPIVATAAMMLVEQGRLDVDSPVSRYLPAFKGLQVGVEKTDAAGKAELLLQPAQREMTVRDLLLHTSGLTYGFFGRSMVKSQYNAARVAVPTQTNEEMVVKLGQIPLQNQPGAVWDYSMSTDVLGRVVEVASGMTLGDFLSQRILKPLKMQDTAFVAVDAARVAEAAPDAAGKPTVLPNVLVKGWESGGGGLTTTAMDYARFCQMLLNGGELDGARILTRASVTQLTAHQLPAGVRINNLPSPFNDVRPAVGQGFGFVGMVRTADAGAFPGSVGDFSWTGVWGTMFWVDPKQELFALMLTQMPFGAASSAVSVRNSMEMRKAVYEALGRP